MEFGAPDDSDAATLFFWPVVLPSDTLVVQLGSRRGTMTDYEDDDTNPPSDRRTYRNYLLRAKGVQDWSDIEAVNGIHVGLTQGAIT